MKIQKSENVNFSSRNPSIRFADNIARRINQECPMKSMTKFQTYIKKPYTLGHLSYNIKEVRERIYDILFSDKNIVTKTSSIIDIIKRYKIGNCGESSLLTFITAKLNGLKNCKIASLSSKSGISLDHSAVIVQEEKPYIIDSWLGFADYIPNTLQKYQQEYRKLLIQPSDKDVQIKFTTSEYNFMKNFTEGFKDKDIKRLRKKYPELVLK